MCERTRRAPGEIPRVGEFASRRASRWDRSRFVGGRPHVYSQFMSDSERYTIDEARIVSEIIDGEAIIVNLANGYYYSLDPPAAEIWGWLEAGWSIAEIVSVIQDRYDCSGADPATAVNTLIGTLIADELIAPRPDPPDLP
jgi:hypothetical protein